jgi:hypothetical protein
MKIIRISQSSYSFYHGTTTGENNETLHSLRQGIKTDIAQGHGQGAGFYVLTRKDDALSHSQGEFRKKGGVPMVVTINAPLDPNNFEIDHEMMQMTSANMIYETWEEGFKKLPERSVVIKGKGKIGTVAIDIENSYRENNFMLFRLHDQSRPTKGSFQIPLGEVAQNVEYAAWLGTIYNAIKKHSPEVLAKSEQISLQKSIEHGGGLKYIGPTIQPSKLEALINGQWIDVTTQDPPQQNPPQQNPPQQNPPQQEQIKQDPKQAKRYMKIIKISYIEDQKHPHDLEDPMGHVTIAEIKDYLKGFIVGWRRKEIEDHINECPRCEDNFITIKNRMK